MDAGVSPMRKRGRDFGRVSRLSPDAVGKPGARRFRLVALSGDSTACLWMEKEQLQALGMAIDQVLAPLAVLWSKSEPALAGPVDPIPAPASYDVEFDVARLGLSYDERQESFTLLAHDSDSSDEESPTFACTADREQLQSLSKSIAALVASGRPRCPLCGRAIESEPHVCAGSNGHSAH
jgi:uncharacterized repeat protein (TIGR03847 family)